MPRKFLVPYLKLYAGASNPIDYVMHMRKQMMLYQENNAIFYKTILTNLEEGELS